MNEVNWQAVAWNGSYAGFFTRFFGGPAIKAWIDAPMLAQGAAGRLLYSHNGRAGCRCFQAGEIIGSEALCGCVGSDNDSGHVVDIATGMELLLSVADHQFYCYLEFNSRSAQWPNL